jgi:RHS repeat-associated protein
VTEFAYDGWGQLNLESEGPPSPGRTSPTAVSTETGCDVVGRSISFMNGLTCANITYDDNGNITSAGRCFYGIGGGGGGGRQTTWPPISTCPGPVMGDLQGSFNADPYTGMGQPTRFVNTVEDLTPNWYESSTREQRFSFDELGRTTERTASTIEATWDQSTPTPIERTFTHAPDWTTGASDRTGPDGQQTHVVSDAAGRPVSMTHGSISATTTYDAGNQPDTITHGNGTRTKYTHDDAGRTTAIGHETTAAVRIHELQYDLSADGLVTTITETDDAGNVSTTSFTYDNRNRLTAEVRVGQHGYDLSYAYDIAGNRTQKVDALNDVVTDYTYDVSDPTLYGSQGNRLMSSSTRISGQLVEERWYTYDAIGNADFVSRRIAGDEDVSGNQWYRGTRLYYAKNGHLWLARSERWQLDSGTGQPVNCEPLAAMEYRYNSGRQRYLVRPRDPVSMLPYAAFDGRWSDYDGESIYGDYTVSQDGPTFNVSDTMFHEPGLAQFDPSLGEPHYLHGNLIGTTEAVSDELSAVSGRRVYTAFGEPVYADGITGSRYGYAAAWGYESAENLDPLANLGWLHVGARYYDPAVGRFMQRDPIGTLGGLNVYAYVRNNPLRSVDPSGLYNEWAGACGRSFRAH